MTAVSRAGNIAMQTVGLQEYREAINELRDLINSGTLSRSERARARRLFNELNHRMGSLRRSWGAFSTRASYNRLMEAVRSADTFVEAKRETSCLTAEALFDSDPRVAARGRLSEEVLVRVSGRIDKNLSNGSFLREMFENNPREFAAQWKKLDAEERQLAMFSLQQEMQNQAQLTSMMTSMLKTMHDSAMAIARNLAA